MNLAETVDLIVNLKLNNEASGKLKGFSTDLAGIGTKMTSAGKTLTAGLTLPILGAAAGVIKLAMDAEQTDARLSAAFKSMGADSWTSLEKLRLKADELMSKTTFDDDAIKDTQAVLLTFGNVTGDVFDQGIEAALNMSAALGTDLQSAAIQVGKALNDPVAGVSALTRVGVSFTQQQKDQIKVMQEAGDTAGAQAIIIGELKKQFGGMAEAIAKTDTGQMQQAMNELGEAGEEIGKLLLPVIRDAAGLIKDLAKWFQGLSPEVKTAVVQVAALAAVLGPVLFIGGKLIGTLGSLVGVVGKLAGGFETAATKGLAFKGALLGVGVAAGTFAAGVLIANEAGNELEGQYAAGTEAIKGMTSATEEQIETLERDGRTAIERADALKFMGFWDTEASVALRTLGEEALITAERLRTGGKGGVEGWTQSMRELMGTIPPVTAAVEDELVPGMEQAGAAAGTALGVATTRSIHESMEAAARAARDHARDLTIGLSDTIRASKGNVVDAMDDLKWAMLHPLAGAKALARIEGKLTGNRLAEGLASQNPFIQAQAAESRRLLIAEWERISGRAYTEGAQGANQLEAGLRTFTPVKVTPFVLGKTASQYGGFLNRQHGGPVQAGVPYIVGEKRPELFVPNQSGTIVPRVPMGGVSQQPIQVNVTANVMLNARAVAQELNRTNTLTQARLR